MTTAADLADETLDALLDAYPVAATLLGLRGRDNKLADYSEAGDEATRTRLGDIEARARTLDVASGGPHDGGTLGGRRQHIEAQRDRLDSRTVEYTVTDHFASPVTDLLFSLPMTGIAEPAH